MRVRSVLNLGALNSWEDLRRYCSDSITQIITVLNGRVSVTENLETSLVSATFIAASSTITITHTLQKIPDGYIVVGKSANFVVFDGNKTNTDAVIYLQASAAGTARVLVF